MEENSLTPDEELRIENELKQLNLELTYGAQSYLGEDAPPELISAWLDNVKNYEEQYANAPKVPVFDFIGKPALRQTAELTEEELEPEIERILELLIKKQVLIDRPEHLPARYYHTFLTEEFMRHEMTDHSAPGMMHFFNYDEFHHDSPEHIRQHVSDFLLDLLNLGRDFEGAWLSENCRDDHFSITKDEVIRRVNIFRAMHRELVPVAFQAEKTEVHNGATYLFFGVAWDGIPVGETEKKRHEGMGICQLDWVEDEWMIQGVNMPGFSF